jgi:hypothetical protein
MVDDASFAVARFEIDRPAVRAVARHRNAEHLLKNLPPPLHAKLHAVAPLLDQRIKPGNKEMEPNGLAEARAS